MEGTTKAASGIAGGSFPDGSCASAVCSGNADRTFTCPAPDASVPPDAAAQR